MKKSVIANIIFTFILISIAVNMGVFLVNIIEKNKFLIKKSEYPLFDKVNLVVKDKLQDPEYFRFFVLTNSPLSVNIYFYSVENNLKVNKSYNVDGYVEIIENLTSLFGVNLDNTNLVIYYQLEKTPQIEGASVHLKTANKILVINTNIPSFVEFGQLSEIFPGKNVFYIYHNIDEIKWYSPYQYQLITLSANKIENIDLIEDFNLDQFLLVFEDNNGDPVVNVEVYINNFRVGITDSNGELIVNYHRNVDGYIKIEDSCYYFSDLITFRRATITITANNLC